MTGYPYLEKPHQPDWRALIDNILRKGTPRRVHHMELYHDQEVAQAVVERYHLVDDVAAGDPNRGRLAHVRLRRFLGFDYVRAGLEGMDFKLRSQRIEDTAALPRSTGRNYMDEHVGPITNWEEFEEFSWPDPNAAGAADSIEWFQKNLPDDMCIEVQTGHFEELLSGLMGYETLCYALADQRDLVQAIHDRIVEFHQAEMKRVLQYDRVRILWGSDDMGFKTGLLMSPDDTRQFVLPGHKKLARMVHDAGRVYLLHCCGKVDAIMDDLVHDVRIDAKHSFEDTIEDVRQAKRSYGREIALIGGLDVDFLCRSSEEDIRRRVRDTLEVCLPGGGYCLGTGNSVARYIPIDNYLVMVDEGWKYSETR